jgi:hypothetical protein
MDKRHWKQNTIVSREDLITGIPLIRIRNVVGIDVPTAVVSVPICIHRSENVGHLVSATIRITILRLILGLNLVRGLKARRPQIPILVCCFLGILISHAHAKRIRHDPGKIIFQGHGGKTVAVPQNSYLRFLLYHDIKRPPSLPKKIRGPKGHSVREEC